MAVIEFTPEGRVISANENFLKTTQYSLHEIVGQHHSMFCHRAEAESQGYRNFWASLNRGEYHSHRFERKNKQGQTIYLEASYNPLFDAKGRLYKVVKFASDITQQMTTLQTAADSAHSTSVQNDACARKGSEVVQQTVQIIQDISRDLNQAALSIDAVSQQSDIIGTIVQTIRGLPIRPTCWRSTPPSKRPVPASMGEGLPWWPMKCAALPHAPARPPWKLSMWCARTTTCH